METVYTSVFLCLVSSESMDCSLRQVFGQQQNFRQTFTLSGQQTFGQLNPQLQQQLSDQLTTPLSSVPLNTPLSTSVLTAALNAPLTSQNQHQQQLGSALNTLQQNQFTFQVSSGARKPCVLLYPVSPSFHPSGMQPGVRGGGGGKTFKKRSLLLKSSCSTAPPSFGFFPLCAVFSCFDTTGCEAYSFATDGYGIFMAMHVKGGVRHKQVCAKVVSVDSEGQKTVPQPALTGD